MNAKCVVSVALLDAVVLLLLSNYAFSADPTLADKHKAAGLTCDLCHGDGNKTAVSTDRCLSCHESYAKVAERTKGVEPNPHDNHIVDLDCRKCHVGHKAQENYCRTCHAELEFHKTKSTN